MKYKVLFLCFVILLALGVSGCKSSNETLEPTPASSIEATPTTIRSKTSGRILEAEPVYKPIGIMIENSSPARPQTGLQAADIVYEAPVESSITRFFCVFNDNLPDIVGPIRSARLYYIRFAQEWDCIYVHVGGANSGLSDVFTDEGLGQVRLDIDFDRGYTKYYWRTGNKGVHTVHTNVQELQTLVDEESQGRTFLFDENTTHAGNAFSEVTLPFYGDEAVYKYDSNTGLLTRYQGTKAFIDKATGKAVTIQNLIVQYNHYYRGNESSGRRLCDINGTGKAEYFIGGVHFTGTWEKDSYDSPTIYRDSDGNEIVLRPGNTWIASHPDTVEITVQ